MVDYKTRDELIELGFPAFLVDGACNMQKAGVADIRPSPERLEEVLRAIDAKHPELFKQEPTLYERIKRYFVFVG